MRKRLLTLTICAVMVSAFTITCAVSALEAGMSPIRQYDIVYGKDAVVVGKLTVNVETGHYVANANLAKAGAAAKEAAKLLAGSDKVVLEVNAGMGKPIPVTINEGGELSSEGLLLVNDFAGFVGDVSFVINVL